MPVGGKYSASRAATIRLQSAAHFESGKFFVLPDAASPSYCSGATYLVFMKTIEALRARGDLQLDYETLDRLMIRGQRDGEGIWGRWNANGPGTARLFYELGIGRNFDDFAEARAGRFHEDFLVAGSRPRGARALGHLSRDGEEAGPRLRALLVEQHSLRLRRKQRPAEQDRPRHFLATLRAVEPERKSRPCQRSIVISRASSASDRATQRRGKSAGCRFA